MPIPTNNQAIPYLPSIAWFREYMEAELEGKEYPGIGDHAPNRTLICGAWGEQTLTVPILGGRRRLHDTPYQGLELSEHGNWRHTHWQAITSAYGAYPYFRDCERELSRHYDGHHLLLSRLNKGLLESVIQLTNLHELTRYIAYDPSRRPHRRSLPVPVERSILELIFLKGPETIFYL